jgi:PKD repeat protein
MNTTGWNLAGDAQVTNVIGSADTELLLCPAIESNSGAAFFGQPINLAFCNKWVAEFDFRMYDGTGADGMAFCFLDVPPTGYVNGGGLGIPQSANGLKVCFDTWNNCIPFNPATVHQDMPKIEVRWGIGYNQVQGGDTIIGECVTDMPTLANTTGELSYIRGPNYNRAMIVYDTGNISVYVNDTLYISTYQPNLFNFVGYMGFTASTGGYTDDHSIKNVIIYTQMPQSFAGASQAFCPYDTVQLGGPGNPTYTYTWSPPMGLSDTTSAAPFLHLSNNSDDSALHKYYVRTAFGDNPGCSSVDSVTVKVYPNPAVNFTMPKICLNDAVGQFNDSSYTGDAETLPFTYSWNFGDPNALPPGNPNYSSLQNPIHRYSAAANYNMSLTVTNSEGCVDSASKIFTVNGDNPVAVFQVLSPTQLCSNSPVEIENLSTVNFGSVVAVQIFWGDTAGVSYTDSMPYSGKVYTHNYPNPVSSSTIAYMIQVIAASGLTCQNATDQRIALNPSPHVEFAAIPALCEVDTATDIMEATELTGLEGTGFYSGRGITPGGVLNPVRAGPGTGSLLYVYTASDGCSDSAYQTVFIQSPPTVRAGDDTVVVIGQPLQLNAWSSDGSADTFLWTPPEGLNNPGIADPIAVLGSGIDSIRYMVTATDSVGCVGESSLRVTVFSTLPDLLVPNAFTPGRASNSVFRPVPVGISRLDYFRVYNRLGELVYSTSQMGEGWDGRVSGVVQGSGTYVWVAEALTYAGVKIVKNGFVILVR